MPYDGMGLTPLFHSEISSSYLLFDIFDMHRAITAAFIEEFYSLEVDILWIEREMQTNQGTIDLFIAFTANNRRCALLIEVKVHDYLSVRENQIRDYYQAVSEDQRFDELYFIYLTQFNEESETDDARPPPSLDEAAIGKELIGERFHHLTWEDVHIFLEKHEAKFSTEQRLMIELQRSWIIEKEETDLAGNTTVTGGRSLEYYLGDVSETLTELESLGRKRAHKLEIDLTSLNGAKLDVVLKAIQDLTKSKRVDIKKKFETKEHTIQAAAEFFSEMITEREWNLLRFYTALFHFADKNSHLLLNGKGDFSIKLKVIDEPVISLCRLRRKKSVEFSLKR